MSRLYEALAALGMEDFGAGVVPPEVSLPASGPQPVPMKPTALEQARCVRAKVLPEARLVALSEPSSLGAEQYRVLATRLDNLSKQRPLKSLQVTSSGMKEGKTLVAANLALTLATHPSSKVLLVEGELRRPALATLFGLPNVEGLCQWWSELDAELGWYLHRLHDMPLWVLPAGKAHDQPSEILHSARFAKAFARLAEQFEWVVVDSTPLSPVVDASLWSRLVDGALLVVREGVGSVKTLRSGVQGFDQPKWLAVVLNEASEFDGAECGSKPKWISRNRILGLTDGR